MQALQEILGARRIRCMNNGFDEKDGNEYGHPDRFGSERPPYGRERESDDPPVIDPPGESDPPVKEPPGENPPLKQPPTDDPPLEIPPGEDNPRRMPPAEDPERENLTDMKFKHIAPRDGKEADYDSRNYTYNIDRTFDWDQFGGNPRTGESQSPERRALEGPPSYTGYAIRPPEEREGYDKGPQHVRRDNDPPQYKVYENRNQEKKSRSLLATLGIVLLGAVIGTGLTLAAMKYFFSDNGVLFGPGTDLTGSTSGLTATRTLITAPAVDIGDTFENRVAEKAIPSVVGITMRTHSQAPVFGGEGRGIIQGMGSGVIVTEDGYIVTNSHVVAGGDAWELKIILSDETVVDGEVLWSDDALDLAIVKADAAGLKPVEIGTSETIRVGDKAIAIGNPLGMNLQSTMTSGYISGLDRSININDGSSMDGLIQTDAAINEGNSGGALLNSAGQLIGINTAKAGGNASGIGFAIPIDTAAPIIREVMEKGSFESVYMGFMGTNLATIKAVNNSVTFEGNDGVYISEVMEGTAADTAGLKRNDIITDINGELVTGMTGMKMILLKYELGDTISITYYRNNIKQTTELTFAQDSSTIDQYSTKPQTDP